MSWITFTEEQLSDLGTSALREAGVTATVQVIFMTYGGLAVIVDDGELPTFRTLIYSSEFLDGWTPLLVERYKYWDTHRDETKGICK